MGHGTVDRLQNNGLVQLPEEGRMHSVFIEILVNND